jgi:ATP-dependent DNA helicase RecG
LLTEAFYLTGDIEKYGTGFKRINDWLKDYPELTLDIYDLNDFFKVVLSNQKSTQKSTQKGTQEGTQKSTREKVLNILTETPDITRERIAIKLDISTNAIKKHLTNIKLCYIF